MSPWAHSRHRGRRPRCKLSEVEQTVARNPRLHAIPAVGGTATDLAVRSEQRRTMENNILAEGVGFEPTVPLQARRFSRLVPGLTSPYVLLQHLMPTAC